MTICSGRRRRSASRAAHTRAHWLWSEPSTPTTIPGAGGPAVAIPCRVRMQLVWPMGSASSRYCLMLRLFCQKQAHFRRHRQAVRDPGCVTALFSFQLFSVRRPVSKQASGRADRPGTGRARVCTARELDPPAMRPGGGIAGSQCFRRAIQRPKSSVVFEALLIRDLCFRTHPDGAWSACWGNGRVQGADALRFETIRGGTCSVKHAWHGGTERTTTVIIGTGLSGLAVASELRRRGVDSIIVGRA